METCDSCKQLAHNIYRVECGAGDVRSMCNDCRNDWDAHVAFSDSVDKVVKSGKIIKTGY